MNKRSKALKALSSAILGTLTIGNCSNVWMMEKAKPSNEKEQKAKVIAGFVTKIKSGVEKKIKTKPEEFDEERVKAFNDSDFPKIFAEKAMSLTKYTMDKELEDLVLYYAINVTIDRYIKQSRPLFCKEIEILAEYFVHISQIAKKVMQELIKSFPTNEKSFRKNTPKIVYEACNGTNFFSKRPSYLVSINDFFQNEDLIAECIVKCMTDFITKNIENCIEFSDINKLIEWISNHIKSLLLDQKFPKKVQI